MERTHICQLTSFEWEVPDSASGGLACMYRSRHRAYCSPGSSFAHTDLMKERKRGGERGAERKGSRRERWGERERERGTE